MTIHCQDEHSYENYMKYIAYVNEKKTRTSSQFKIENVVDLNNMRFMG